MSTNSESVSSEELNPDSIITLDFRFVEIDYELWALGEYLDTFEQQLPLLREQKRAEKLAQLRGQNLDKDVDEVSIALQEHYELVDHALPRLFRGPFLVALWSVYESAVVDVANYIKDQQKQSLAMDDIRGNFLDRAQKYFDHILKFPLYTDDQVWQHLRMLAELRNAIAHANGRIEAVRKTSQRKINDWEKQDIGVEIVHGWLLLSEDFSREAYQTVRDSLQDLVARVKSAY